MKRRVALAGCVVAVLLLGGCVGSSKPSQTATPSHSVASGSTISGAKTQTSWYGGGEVTSTVHPIEVVDDHAVLVVDFALDSRGEGFTVGYALQANSENKGSGGICLVDLEDDRVWTAGYDTEGVPAATQGRLFLEPGESITTVTMFAAPDGDEVDVLLPGVGLVPDVPVVEGDSGTPSVASLELSGKVTFPKAVQLGIYTQSYLDGVSVSGEGDDQMVTLASDVLFDTDRYDLTADAAQVVDEAGAAIKAASSGGEVRVVGHTDDVLSEEYNLELSINRAQTVADRLGQDLGDGFTIVSEGKGKSQPAVQGTDEEARAANRRVEISFTSTQPVGFEGSTIPEPQVPVSSGNEPVEHLDVEGRTLSVSVAKVVRRDGYLVGSLDVSLVKGEPGFPYRWFGYGQFQGNLSGQDREYGAWPVYLLTSEGKVYAAQYKVSWGSDELVSFLADRLLVNDEIPAGRVFRYDVIWPDPGTDTINIEARNAFRITDVPVEDG